MKFGAHLKNNLEVGWEDNYLNYDVLKKMIRTLVDKLIDSPIQYRKGISLTVAPPTNRAGMPVIGKQRNRLGSNNNNTKERKDSDSDQSFTSGFGGSQITQETFFRFLETEIFKVNNFTDKQIMDIRLRLKQLEKKSNNNDNNNNNNRDSSSSSRSNSLVDNISNSISNLSNNITNNNNNKNDNNNKISWEEINIIGEDFLKLEKFVNLNFMGFHKILKKHDKWLPNPCKSFYIARLQNQKWIKGDYSDVLVRMSDLYSSLRGDIVPEHEDNEKQEFVRTTTKYWVREEDVSRVKYLVLQHLPVFLQDTSEKGKLSDAQLVNSVYLDNNAMELYKGRLDKTAGAIALRFRWYGTGEPELVFVERKTHRDSWTGDISVKERFTVLKDQIPSILDGTFDKKAAMDKMKAKGKSNEDIEEWDRLVTECVQAISAKQLISTMRTQYMRTAFQIPFDATVRVSLDTNLCMIQERTSKTGAGGERWYRDPHAAVPKNEITRFPHAVLEVKLQLTDANATPSWVQELLNSGMLQEVHKFSKFIHGCSVLLTDEVQAVPYWIDDESLADSIKMSGAEKLIENDEIEGANKYYQHLLPSNNMKKGISSTMKKQADSSKKEGGFSTFGIEKKKKNNYEEIGGQDEIDLYENEYDDDDDDDESNTPWWDCLGLFPQPTNLARMSLQKVEPKLFFANERTFLHWLHMAVTMSSLSAAVLAFSGSDEIAQLYGLILLPVALSFAMYAIYTFLWRAKLIRMRTTERWDDPFGPMFLGSALALALTCNFFIKLSEVIAANNADN